MAVVLVNRPTVEGSRVYFSWATSKPLEKVKGSKFYFEYVGFDVERLPVWVHFNTVVGLLLARLSEIPERHLVVLDGAVPKWVVDLWGAYHAADNVRIIAEVLPEALGTSTSRIEAAPHFGILFGGGKDSLFALDLLRDAFPEARISLLSYSIPAGHVKIDGLEQRREAFAVQGAARNYGADVVSIRTDVRSVFEPFFHTELYTASLFPVLQLTDLSAVSFSYEYCHYWTSYADGKRYLSFRKSRPEHCAAISRAYSQSLGRRFDLFNANGFMTELSSFLYLAKKRPNFAQEVMMCESTADPNIKWCGSCTKCMEYAFYSAFAGLENTDLPLSAFLTDSKWIKRILPEVQKAFGAFQNNPAQRWFPGLTFPGHADSFGHVVRSLSDNPPKDIDKVASNNLNLLADAFGRKGLETEELAFENVLKQTWPEQLQASALSIIRRNIQTQPDGPRVKYWGNSPVLFDEDIVDSVPHEHSVDFDIAAFAGELTALGGGLPDHNLVYPGTVDTLYIDALGNIERNALFIARGPRWIDVYSSISGPKKGDGFKIHGKLSAPRSLSGPELSLRLTTPHFSSDVRGWIAIKLTINGELALVTDLGHFGGSFLVTAPNVAEAVDLCLEVSALRDCPDWGWGRAMRVCIEVCGWQSTRGGPPGPLRLTYPASYP